MYKEIEEYSKLLRLPKIRKQFLEVSKEAALQDLSYEKFLHTLLEQEYEQRLVNAKQNRVRQAEFPYKKHLEDLSIPDLPEDGQKKLKILKTLDFMKEGQNVILYGNPGTGKTHMAIGLGIKACMEGYKVLFTTIPLLINQLKESRSEQTLRRFENRFMKYDLVIADELGYISFDKEGAELLFTHLSMRAGRKSTLVTTNLSFDRWDEIFHDPVMTAAMVDRLTHKSYMVSMNGNSYRYKETKEWIEKSNL
ncbi:IS21-like element helper ATPase IstB [Peptococcaceae bacterium]|nr:IS21-like element helper ATPase IstB [Peptococcaceae bacterium]